MAKKYQRAPAKNMSRVYGKRMPEAPPPEPEPEEDLRGPVDDPRRNLIKMPRLTFLERRMPWE